MDPGSSSTPAGRLDSSATQNTVDQEKMVHNSDNIPRHRITASPRVRAHLTRHRCAYISPICILIIMAVVLPSTFAFCIPYAIQKAINNNELPIQKASIGVVSPTQVRMGLSTELQNPRGQTVSLDAFPLELYNPGSSSSDTIVTLEFPQQLLEGHTTAPVTVEPQVLTVQSQDELRAFLSRAFAAEMTTTIGVRGRTRAHLGSLSYAVSLDKEVTIAGLNKLAGMKITALLPKAPTRDVDPALATATLSGNLTLSNPSQLTLDLGDMHYIVSSAGVTIGRSWVSGLHVVPGEQSIDYQGELYVDDIIDKENDNANMKTMMSSIDEDYRVRFDIVGDRSYVNGEPIGYLDEVVRQIQMSVSPCYTTASQAIPPSKSEFRFMDWIPGDKYAVYGCSESDPLS